jgi:hypothetical protein
VSNFRHRFVTPGQDFLSAPVGLNRRIAALDLILSLRPPLALPLLGWLNTSFRCPNL